MGVKVNVDVTCSRFLKFAKSSQTGQFMANEARDGMDPFVPMDTGQLSGGATATPFKVEYGERYAKPVYYNTRAKFKTDQHSDATALWADKYAKKKGQQLADAMTRYFRSR